MRHVPVFRWLVVAGVLLGCAAAALCVREPETPAVRQVRLTVVSEQAGGACTVRWTDPLGGGRRQGAYTCDSGRWAAHKGPPRAGGTAGTDLGYVIVQGPHKGQLYRLWDDSDGSPGPPHLVDLLCAGALVALAAGLVGGGVRLLAAPVARDVRVARRAVPLLRAAQRTVDDHRRTVRALRAACPPLELVALAGRDAGVTQDVLSLATGRRADHCDMLSNASADLLSALWTLVEAGPHARTAAGQAEEVAGRLTTLLPAAAHPRLCRCRGWDCGGREGRRAVAALAELRGVVLDAERRGLLERFARVSADLRHARESAPTPEAVRADFHVRPDAYRRAFAAHAPHRAGVPG